MLPGIKRQTSPIPLHFLEAVGFAYRNRAAHREGLPLACSPSACPWAQDVGGAAGAALLTLIDMI